MLSVRTIITFIPQALMVCRSMLFRTQHVEPGRQFAKTVSNLMT